MSVGEEKSGVLDGGPVGRRRRRWSDAQKRQIVAETHEPGVSVPMVAQRYNLNANQVLKWRRLFREPEPAAGPGRFVPVVVEGTPGHEAGAAAMGPRSEDDVAVGSPATGRMEIVFSGDRRVIVDRAVSNSPEIENAPCRLRHPQPEGVRNADRAVFGNAAPLYLLPLAMAAADVLENTTVAGLALSHAGAPTPLA